MKKILLILGTFALFTPIFASADTWFPTGSPTVLTPAASTWGLKIPSLSNCTVTKTDVNGVFSCGTGGTGSSGGTFSTSTSQVSGELTNHPNNTTDIVTIGSFSTTTAPFYFDPNLPFAKIGSQLLVTGSTTLQNFTGTQATTTNFFSTSGTFTNLFGTNITGFGLSSCTGTSALTFSGTTFGCAAQPQGTITSLTGDVTGSGTGAVATTLATVASAGTTGGSTAIPVVTINAKGLTTGITTAAVIAPAGTLSGATLASGVTASSLTSLGTLTALNGAGLTTCNSATNALTWAAGTFGCNTITGGGSGTVGTSSAETSGRVPFWTTTSAGVALLSGGVSGFTWNNGTSVLGATNALFTQATTTGLGITGLARPAGAILAVDTAGNIIATTTSSGGVASVTGTTNRITSTGGTNPVIDISGSYVGQSSITTVGTLSAGAVPASLVTAGTFGAGAYSFPSTISVSGTINGTGGLDLSSNSVSLATLGSGGSLLWSGKSSISSPTDGLLELTNNAGTGFTRLQFGGTTASFPSIKRNGTAINFRLADDSADAPITAGNATTSALAITSISSGNCLQTTTGGAIIGSGSACGSGGGSTNTDKFATSTSSFVSVVPNGGTGVGIGTGTTTPQFQLESSSLTAPQFSLDNQNGGTNAKHLVFDYTGSSLLIGTSSDTTFTSTSTALSFTPLGSASLSIGSSSPFALFSLQAFTGNTSDIMQIATSSGAPVQGVDKDGHPYTSGPTPAISTCGTGTGTVAGDDQTGVITTATAATACTATFAKAWAQTPVCTVTDNSLVGFADISSISTTAVTFGISSALTGGNLYYSCNSHR